MMAEPGTIPVHFSRPAPKEEPPPIGPGTVLMYDAKAPGILVYVPDSEEPSGLRQVRNGADQVWYAHFLRDDQSFYGLVTLLGSLHGLRYEPYEGTAYKAVRLVLIDGTRS